MLENVICMILIMICAGMMYLAGYACGVRSVKEKSNPPIPDTLTKREREIMMADQAAFRQMMNYNLDTAYGLSSEGKDLFEEDKP